MTETLIPWRAPLDWQHLSGFLARRAIAGIESFDDDVYVRGAIRVRRHICVCHGADRQDCRFHAGLVMTAPPRGRDLAEGRVRRLFDVETDARAVAEHLKRDRMLAPLVERQPGTRDPRG